MSSLGIAAVILLAPCTLGPPADLPDVGRDGRDLPACLEFHELSDGLRDVIGHGLNPDGEREGSVTARP